MVPAGPDWSWLVLAGQNKNHLRPRKTIIQRHTVNTAGTISPTIIIIKFAKDSSTCKLHRYYAVTTLRGNQSTCPRTIFSPNVNLIHECVRDYGAILTIAIPLQYIALMTWQY